MKKKPVNFFSMKKGFLTCVCRGGGVIDKENSVARRGVHVRNLNMKY